MIQINENEAHEEVEEYIEMDDLDILYNDKKDAHLILKKLYNTLKDKDLSDPFRIVLRSMELVEKMGDMSGSEKKDLVINLVSRVNVDMNLIPPSNLDSIIDTIVFASKHKNKLNKKNIKRVFSILKKLVTFSCLRSKSD